jgi:hypothetical protein
MERKISLLALWTIANNKENILITLEIFIILQLKPQQCDVLKQDNELCPFCYFPATIHIAV